MTQFVALDKKVHAKTRVLTGRGAKFGENIHLLPVIADELTQLVLEYPVCLIKSNETGQFGLQALLGFEPQENLFLKADSWQANYVPLHIKRQPFMVAVNGKAGEQPSENNTVITINMDNSRVQESNGELIFDEAGEPTPFMSEVNQMLSALVNGIIRTEAFINSLNELDLIEPVHLNVSLVGQEQKRFEGIYTVNETKLKQLPSDKLTEMNNKGYLQACYLLLASMGNVQKLIALKRAALAQK